MGRSWPAPHGTLYYAAHGCAAHGHQRDNFSDSPALRLCCSFVHNAKPWGKILFWATRTHHLNGPAPVRNACPNRGETRPRCILTFPILGVFRPMFIRLSFMKERKNCIAKRSLPKRAIRNEPCETNIEACFIRARSHLALHSHCNLLVGAVAAPAQASGIKLCIVFWILKAEGATPIEKSLCW